MYVSYEFYKEAFGTIPEAEFAKAERQAEAYINYLTCVNGDIFAKEDPRVQLAVCAAADVIYQNSQRSGAAGALRSESNDGYSATYVTEAQDGQTAEEVLRKKILEAVRIYLLPTGWLGRRVKMGGCCDVCATCDCAL